MCNFTKEQWAEICPQLTIEDALPVPPIQFPDAQLHTIAEEVWHSGYMALPPLFSDEELAVLVLALEQLKQAKIPPVYIYLFDQPWALFDKLQQLIRFFLGDEYALLPNFWAWHLTETGERGWPVHRDCDAQTVFDIGGDQMLMSLSLWVPLSDVDEANGCMYVVDRVAEESLPESTYLDKEFLLPLATALPAKAGAVLGWPQDVIHWGGDFTSKARNPRMSLSFEFQNRQFDPLVEPLLSTATPPDFETRLELLRQQFAKYSHIA